MLDDNQVERALVVMAHPDDVDFGCAGTIATWTKRGIEVTYCIATAGDAGGFDLDLPREQMPGIRRAEQRAAAAEVGVSDVRFLNHSDGAVVLGPDLVRDISRVIRQVRPQRVLCQSPERNYRRMPASHPDHRAVGGATLDAVYPAARNPFAFPELLGDEGLAAWVVPEVWLTAHPSEHPSEDPSAHPAAHPAEDPSGTLYIDVTDTFDSKLAALRAHVSQIAHLPDLEGMLRGWLAENARRAGLPEGRLAESFFRITV